jgi:hypothetical protein
VVGGVAFPAGFQCVAADGTRAECPTAGMVFVIDDQSGEFLGRPVEWQ